MKFFVLFDLFIPWIHTGLEGGGFAIATPFCVFVWYRP